MGGFAYSHGIEGAVEDGTIATATDLEDWLCDLLQTGSLRADAVLLCVAHSSPVEGLDSLDQTARAFAATKERLMETDLQGAAFVDTLTAMSTPTLPHLTYPVAVGAAAAQHHLDRQLTCALYLQSVIATLVGAAMRLVPLGQAEGQKVQLALKKMCNTTASQLVNATREDLHANTFASDIAAMRHETQYSRIFRS